MPGLWWRDLKTLGGLCVPLIAVQVGAQLLSFTDSAFAGRLGEVELAATGLGSSLFFATSVIGLGVLLGLDPLLSQAFGRGSEHDAKTALRHGLFFAPILALPLGFLVLEIVRHLPSFGIAKDVTEQTLLHLGPRVWCLPLFFGAIAMRGYLQAKHLLRPVFWSTVLMVILNFIFDGLLTFGDQALVSIGFPAVGLEGHGVFGLGLASVVAAGSQAVFLFWVVYGSPLSLRHIRLWPPAFDPTVAKNLLRVGTPIGLYLIAEVGVFSLVQVLMVGIGATAGAAHQVALTLASVSFSACIGIGAATAVQVGRAVGADDHVAARRWGFLGIGFGALLMSVSALAMWLLTEPLVRLVTDENAIVPLAMTLVVIAGFFQIADGIQAVAAGALRGAGSTRITFWGQLLSHWALGLPLGLWLTFVHGLGPPGLWWGLTAGLGVVSVVLTWAFWRLSARPIAGV